MLLPLLLLILLSTVELVELGAGHYALELDGKSQASAPNRELGSQVDVEVCSHLLSGVLPLVNAIIFSANSHWVLGHKFPWAQ